MWSSSGVKRERLESCAGCGIKFGLRILTPSYACGNCKKEFSGSCSKGRTALTIDVKAGLFPVCDKCMVLVTIKLEHEKAEIKKHLEEVEWQFEEERAQFDAAALQFEEALNVFEVKRAEFEERKNTYFDLEMNSLDLQARYFSHDQHSVFVQPLVAAKIGELFEPGRISPIIFHDFHPYDSLELKCAYAGGRRFVYEEYRKEFLEYEQQFLSYKEAFKRRKESYEELLARMKAMRLKDFEYQVSLFDQK